MHPGRLAVGADLLPLGQGKVCARIDHGIGIDSQQWDTCSFP